MNAQVSFEYMIMMAAVIAILVPIWAYMAALNQQTVDSLALSQAQTATHKIASAADLVYTQGPPTQITLNVFFPRGITAATLTNTTVRLTLSTGAGITDVAATTLGPLNGTLPATEGLYSFTIRAVSTYVNISY